MKAIILHGTLGSPQGNWFAWLASELSAKGWQVWLPQLPHADRPSLREWSDFVLADCPFTIDEQTEIIGHSSGAILALIVAQQLSTPATATFCVSVFKDNDFLQWEPNNCLFDVLFNFGAMQKHAGNLTFIHSDDDPYCPLSHAQFFAEKTGGILQVIPGQQHFNTEMGEQYHRFPKLLELIERTRS